jgi:hypothetical protein
MAVRPEVIPFADFVKSHQEEFTPFELWVVDELTEHLVNKLDLDKEYTSVIVDIDEDEPIGNTEGSDIDVRLNGRFYLPKEDRNGKTLELTAEKWADVAKEWFDESELKVTFNTESTDLLKFTVFVAAISLPEASSEGAETPAEEPASADDTEAPPAEESAPEAEETAPSESEEEPAVEKPTKEETAPSEPEDSELKEFEEALGI